MAEAHPIVATWDDISVGHKIILVIGGIVSVLTIVMMLYVRVAAHAPKRDLIVKPHTLISVWNTGCCNRPRSNATSWAPRLRTTNPRPNFEE
jgi:hypothetical protein